ncbi:hypothetical protein [Mucilaginibacter sp.]|uniref:hypothetical protein n=1 Tax=Mucilaginibacter sp. TaxID=1882438 RepID=UPI002631D1D4|nr:hypothetical protein [Mucilaginibacter sp.]MDB4925939.1 hypothetical protein [Mucilaginibacter sp.]
MTKPKSQNSQKSESNKSAITKPQPKKGAAVAIDQAIATVTVEHQPEPTIILKALPKAVETAIGQEDSEFDPVLLESIHAVLSSLQIGQVYFVDDAVNQQTDLATFVGLVQSVLASGKIEELRAIPIQKAIDFQTDEQVLSAHIQQVWENVSPKKQINYFTRVYAIAGQPEAIKDINVSNRLKNFFKEGVLNCLTPHEWDEQRNGIIAGIAAGQRILVLFDQDLKMAGGRFTDDNIRGEDLILETKQQAGAGQVVLTLFTHTVPDHAAELPERQRICREYSALSEQDFFVLTKKRLDKQDEFTDGLKKACLNTYCEQIKDNTLAIVFEAQKRTVDRIKAFDTYEFDQAVFKSSFTEGVWEPETLLRMTDTIFKDEVRRLMLDQAYVTKTNDIIAAARKISNITVNLQDVKEDHTEKFKIRHQELYESPELLNPLRRPIDNGDMFKVTEGAGKNKRYILIAQECDLMVRSEGDKRGKRGANMAVLAEITVVSKDKVLNEQITTYQKQIDKKKFGNHFFADRYQLNYFELGTDKVGIVDFKDTLMVDLNILDLAVFDLTGNSVLDLANPNYSAGYHNAAWQSRYELIEQEYTKIADELDSSYAALDVVADEGRRTSLKAKINRVFSFINPAGVLMNYGNRKFDFGVERTGRLRLPKSKHLLDRYYLHLSRFAEQHDFAEEI